jgi:hypothetical protein
VSAEQGGVEFLGLGEGRVHGVLRVGVQDSGLVLLGVVRAVTVFGIAVLGALFIRVSGMHPQDSSEPSRRRQEEIQKIGGEIRVS